MGGKNWNYVEGEWVEVITSLYLCVCGSRGEDLFGKICM